MKRKYFYFWVLWALLGFVFHEAWRDEAQAWLVAKEARQLKELFFLSSLEATPPVYYLLLWPLAQVFPASFPFLQWLVSFSGTALSVFLLRKSSLLLSPLILLLFIFSFPMGYEFSVISRLYGWGFFFLVLGIYLDQKKRKTSAVFFGLSALTQGPFGLAVLSYYFYKLWDLGIKFFRIYWSQILILFLFFVFFLWHAGLASQIREWSLNPQLPKRLSLVGGTLASVFLHSPGNLGYLGFVLWIAAFFCLPRKTRAPFVLMSLGHVFIFSFIYGHHAGAAKPRHGFALFFMFLYFFFQDSPRALFTQIRTPKELWSHLKARVILKNKRYFWAEVFLIFLLIFSVASGLWTRLEDLAFQYSDSRKIVQILKNESKESLQIYAWDEQDTYAIAAYLNTSIFVGSKFTEVRAPQYTRQRNEERKWDFSDGLNWRAIKKNCPSNRKCFLVLKKSYGEVPLEFQNNFKLIYAASKTLSDESLNLFAIQP